MTRLLPTDADLAPNAGPFRFRLSEESEDGARFQLDEATGELRSRGPVDREATPALHLVLEISDAGTPPLAAKFPFTVTVADENDNPSEPRILTVIVQTLNGDFTGGRVAPVRPKDPDTSGELITIFFILGLQNNNFSPKIFCVKIFAKYSSKKLLM